METLSNLLLILGSDFFEAVKKVFGVAVVGFLVLFVAERTLIKRHIASEILPMWSMLMAYFLTIKGRLDEIERASVEVLGRLGVPLPDSGSETAHHFGPDMWKGTAPGSLRYELKRALQESRLAPEEQRELFAPLISALLKLKNDSELLSRYSSHLFEKIMSLWSEKLHLFNAVGGGVESMYVVSKEAEAMDFYVARHLDILLLYLESYNAGDREDIVCENIANYWPYFIGQADRLLATARDEFLQQHLGEKERKTLTLRGRVEFIGETLDEAKEEIGRKVGGTMPDVRVDTIWGR
jgi:hypothetical protein